MERFAEVAGEVLRFARRKRGLTLRDVWRRSAGEFKPSALGGYERGERSISLDKFCHLSVIYGEPPDRLLTEVISDVNPGFRQKLIVDLNALNDLGDAEGPHSESVRALGRFVHSIRSERGDFLTNVVSLRSGDLEAFALELGMSPRTLLKRLERALRTPGDLETRGHVDEPFTEVHALRP